METATAAPAPKPFHAPEFRNRTLGGFNAEQEEALWNDRDPQISLKSEKPIHRRMAELNLQGFNHKEIGALTGYDERYVSNILRQPHARVHMIEASKRPLQEELVEFLDAEVMQSLRVLKTIRDDPTSKASDRISAAKEIADRRLGRPTQPFAQKDKAPSEMTMEELESEVKNILAENGRSKESATS